jgi:hypothetical protein
LTLDSELSHQHVWVAIERGSAEKEELAVQAVDAGIYRLVPPALDDYPESEWLFGNVYADDGETPLSWWE